MLICVDHAVALTLELDRATGGAGGRRWAALRLLDPVELLHDLAAKLSKNYQLQESSWLSEPDSICERERERLSKNLLTQDSLFLTSNSLVIMANPY